MTTPALTKFYETLADIRKLEEILGILDWDRAVNLPPAGSAARAEQIQYISVQIHQRRTDPAFAELLAGPQAQRSNLSQDDWINVRETARKISRQSKLPADFVARQAHLQSVSYDAWAAAKPSSDFNAVKQNLGELIELAREEAALVGFSEHPYDALLDIYEPDAKLSFVKPLLQKLSEGLRQQLPQISEKFRASPKLSGKFPADRQHQVSLKILERIGFDFRQGRLDVSPHPFSANLGYVDWRITTRYHEDNCLSAIYSTLHEAGHAFYEIGLGKKFNGTPRGTAVSLGIHESQSRLWENLVGRSAEFAEFLQPVLAQGFPETFSTMTPRQLWLQLNYVSPSLIRVEADEVSYSLHILIRMLLEEALIAGALSIDDLPDAWSEHYQKYLGIRPQNHREGVMQDVHWYSGSFGYFPTYALGNLYGVVILDCARKNDCGLPPSIRAGDFSSLHSWLRTNIHEPGMSFYGPELLRRISGQELSEKPFLNYVIEKFNF